MSDRSRVEWVYEERQETEAERKKRMESKHDWGPFIGWFYFFVLTQLAVIVLMKCC
jgi:hypothetical protein